MSAPVQQVCAALPAYGEIEKSSQAAEMPPAPGMAMGPCPGMVMAPGPGMVMAPGPGMVMAPGVTLAPATTISLQRVHSRDFLVWSIFNVIHMNILCLGFIAVAFSVKARDRRFVGDQNGAKHYGNTAKHLNIAATVLTVLVYLILIILAFFGAFTAVYYG